MTMLQADPQHGAEAAQAATPALPDRDLVARVRAGDAAAFELIMRRHNRRLFRLARSILRNGFEAEDVVQATYVQAYAKLDEFVGPHGFPAWLGRIAINEALGRLRRLGVRLAIDDFGSGHTSLGYLRRLPVDEVKIDKSFVKAMPTSAADAAIVRAAVDLGHSLGLAVVAEGVEDADTWRTLANLGCDQVQGYYLSHPLPPAAAEEWLRGRVAC